jgi:diguanylate cyclase (GGDEF)-like protein
MPETGKPRILLVVEDAAFAAELAALLGAAGYETRAEAAQRAALDAALEWKPGLLLLDILARGFNPLEFLAELKKSPVTEAQKVIAVSRADKADIIAGPAPKVSGYLNKPIDFDALKALLHKEAGLPSPCSQPLVLVADDDAEFSDLIKMFLEANGYRALVINDPLRVMEAVRAERPALLLLDLMMPNKDGFGIIEELRADPATAGVPVVVQSGLRLNNYQERGVLTGLPEIVSRELPADLLLRLVAEQLPAAGAAAPQAATEQARPSLPRVLLADDQTELLLLMKEMMESSGFEVFTASDGEEAMRMVFETHPDIIVMDYNMPRKDGLAVAQDLKNNPLFAHIPIIICTAYSQKQTKLKGLSMGIDDYLIKPVDTDELIARIRMILKRNKLVLDTNPLSKLPGNPSIQARVEREIAKGGKFAVLYLDLNNFKAYNDIYGFEAGDRIIKATANLLVKLTIQNENSTDFIGHIGGDDFIVITEFARCEDLARRIVTAFDEIAPSFYTKADRERGHIIATDRQGNIKKFPFLSIAIGVVNNMTRQLLSFAQVGSIGSELKKGAKAAPKSHYVIDRRHD